MMQDIQLRSNRRMELIDITQKVNDIIAGSEVGDGLAVIFTKHTTTALIVNEYEPGLVSDIEKFLTDMVPKLDYRHDRIDDNADSHLRSIILQSSLAIPVKDCRLDLGTWQRLIFIELDGPRNRTVTTGIFSGH